ncbi:MAG: glycosyltransferase family 4 protein [Xanthomonadales bacterium]|nr:glycosyltransferase family 4 protein [Xanthomonadales bacterium]
MERFNERVVAQLSRDFDVSVCGPEGCEAFLPEGTLVASVRVRPLPLFLVRAAFASLRMARHARPDVVIAGSGLTAPLALLVARSFRVPALVFLYGLDLVVSNRWYQRLWIPAIRACDGFLPISRHTRDLAIAKGLDPSKMDIVTPGVDPVDDAVGDASNFRENHQLGDRPILLSVGRLTRRKGLVEFIRDCLPDIVARQPEVILVVIGGEPADALAGNRGGVSDDARAVAKSLGIERNVQLLGSVSDATVRAAYHASQVHVFPILDIPGDVEGFGMVALEAAIVGVPTVAFSVGGVPDAIAPGISGALIAPGNYPGMAEAILRYVDASASRETDSQRHACITFAREFEWDKIGDRLKAVISRLAGF